MKYSTISITCAKETKMCITTGRIRQIYMYGHGI